MAEGKKSRSMGAYSVSGSTVKVVQTGDPHCLWGDLFFITESQIAVLKGKILSGRELDSKDMQKLDSCYGGMKKLLEIEAILKSDKVAAMSDDDLVKVARKAIRERKATPDDS